ncbi:MAG: hypothetical protein ACRELD_09975 [Longimicrobiales bacterium]
MPSPSRIARIAAATVLSTLGVAACDDVDTAGPRAAAPPGDPALQVGELTTSAVREEFFKVCKNGPTSDFDVYEDGAWKRVVTVEDGLCRYAAMGILEPGFGTPTMVVRVVERVPPGHFVSQIAVETGSATVKSYVLTGTDEVTESIGGSASTVGFQGAVAVFANEPLPSGQGCTPGYWKQPHHFDSWVGYAPGQQFSSVFDDAFPGMTLLEVLQQGGGGLKALGRHTVAALLNASSGIAYGLSANDVINAFNATFEGTDRDYEALKNDFEARNESGCPLN